MFEYITNTLLPTTWKIFATPWLHNRTLWMILPLIIILVLIHLYFGRYKTEELGWNSAFGNTISLLWICVILFRLFFEQNTPEMIAADPIILKKMFMMILLSLWVFSLLIFNFFHILPRKFLFLISSADGVYILAYIIISMVVGNIDVTIDTLLAAAVIFVVILLILEFIRYIIPASKEAQLTLKRREEKKKKEEAIEKGVKTRKWNEFIKHIRLKKRRIKHKSKKILALIGLSRNSLNKKNK